MFVGPIFTREALTAPRQLRHFLMRSGYVALLVVLMYTAAQATFGWQQVRNVGDIARFGGLAFQIFSLVQLLLVMFFALLLTAGNIAQEKDRQTLVLLLMTDLRNRELVLGKLTASLLIVGVLIATSVPVFVMLHHLGGVSLDQIGWAIALCTFTALAAGSWGALVAFWREKTFQTLATSVLGAVFCLGIAEAVLAFAADGSLPARIAAMFNPFRALLAILDPLSHPAGAGSAAELAQGSVFVMAGLAVFLNLVTVARLRVWNPSRVFHVPDTEDGDEAAGSLRVHHRRIWSNPVVWREICTRAYGRKVFVIKLAYLCLAAFAVFQLTGAADSQRLVLGMITQEGFAFVGLGLLSLVLINAQAVTALTTERDTKTLELLLVTDITAKEFIYGKLGGVLFNTKELLAVPMGLIGWYVWQGQLGVENAIYTLIGFVVLALFSSMLGLHSGLSFENSRSAIANSLGTMFFLFVGIFIFMMLLVEARSSFFLQFQSFLLFIGAGSIGLYASLTKQNPSVALGLSAGVLPFLTFYAITEFLLQGTLGVCLAITLAYGFTTLAMLVPAVSEFDVALGRTTLDKG